ncbi:MarR family winged helix-turn-helix transcriptional regulator [Dactylosporangium sp. NPDC051541]|uniref:MarR family winged helix-turn-helix transcriptional regulator n=1 Tax=Dactylosporangium sp. NPDC051541 TaxID=3363977 RepID=UPI00379B5751
MSSVSPSRRRTANAIKERLRALSTQLSLLNHRVGARLEIKDADFNCLDLVQRHGPLSPSALARRAGLHPATMTGVLDRLERAGWVTRDRDPADRRAVLIRAARERNAEIYALFGGMNGRMDDLLAGYSEEQLEVLQSFLEQVTEAGRDAADEFS